MSDFESAKMIILQDNLDSLPHIVETFFCLDLSKIAWRHFDRDYYVLDSKGLTKM